jgi:hypothetical protein
MAGNRNSSYTKYTLEKNYALSSRDQGFVLSLSSRGSVLAKSNGKRHGPSWFLVFPAGGYGMDVTKKNKRDGTEVTERSNT